MLARNPAAVAKALIRAQSAAAVTPQVSGFGGPPGITGGPSPLVASYGDWSAGSVRSQWSGLPRDWQMFASGAFGPLTPMRPVNIDTPPPGEDRPEPRRFQYPVSWNIPHGVPGDEGLKLASFASLRTIADSYSIARACLQLRKAELVGLGWDIAPTKDAEKAMRGDRKARSEFDGRRAKLLKFFRKPDPNYFTFSSWFGALLEDVLVVDALSIYLHPSRTPGKGVMGSNLAALDAIDGTTIRPLLSISGSKPAPPNPAYQQYLFGVPRSDMLSMLSGDDVVDMSDAMAREYRGDQLLYLPMVNRSWTPYGFGPVERALVPTLIGIQRQQYQLSYFSEGSVPGMFISAGDPNATPNQLRELQDALNAMAGDPAWKHKIIVIPKDSKIDPMRPIPLADQLDEIIATQVCMSYDVMPMELGISPKVSTTQCYAEGTEVLTRAGWKPFEQVQVGLGGDEFATRDPKTQRFEWQHATEYHEGDFDGEMVEFANRDCRLTVTPNHRMLLQWQEARSRRGGRTGECIREAGEIESRKVAIPATSEWVAPTPTTVRFGKYEWSTVDFAAFLGAYIAEGSLGRQYNKLRKCDSREVILTQVRGTKGFVPYRDLLARMLNREPGYRESSRSFFFSCSDLWHYLNKLGKAHEKYVPEEVKNWGTEALESFLHFYLLGDGHSDGGRWRSRTVSPRLADDLQEVAQKLGFSASITRREPTDAHIEGRLIPAANCRPSYVVGFRKGRVRAVNVNHVRYAGKVRCVSVPNGILYVRSNDGSNAPMTAVWCGNSSGAANQMAKASQSTHDRKANVPLLEFFADIFNVIIQDVCGQEDMRWLWDGMEEGEDEERKTTILVQQINSGLASVDEGRLELGKQPWGLPLTSDPIVMTPTGPIPFGSIDPSTGQPVGNLPGGPGAPPAVPGAPPPTGEVPAQGGQPKPKPASGGAQPAATPAHAGAQAAAQTKPLRPAQTEKPQEPAKPVTKAAVAVHAALRELDLIRRRLHKGRALNGWQPEHIPADVFATLAKTVSVDPDGAVNQARVAVKAAGHRQLRDTSTAHLSARVAAGLKDLAIQLGDGKISTPAFVDAGVELLRGAIHEALLTGHSHANGTESVTKAAWVDPLNGRWQQYAGAVPQAYEHGFGLATLGSASNPDDILIRWHAKPGACALCAPRDGQLFTTGSLPGWPGDGGYGKVGKDGTITGDATVCLGGPGCRCSLEFVPFNPDLLAELAPVATLGTPAQQDIAADILAVRRAVDTGDSSQVDAALAQIASRKAEAQRPYLMGLLQDVLSAISRGVTAFRDWLVESGIIGTAEKAFDPAETRDEHGRWTVIGAAMHDLESIIGKAYSQDELEHNYGNAIDSDEFATGAHAELGGHGDIHIDLAGAVEDTYHVFADMTPEDAVDVSDALSWAHDRVWGSTEMGHRPPDPRNGLADWRYLGEESPWVVGYTPERTIRFGSDQGGQGIAMLDLSPDQALHLMRTLDQLSMLGLSDEGEAKAAKPSRKPTKVWDGACRLPIRVDPATWYIQPGHEYQPRRIGSRVEKAAADIGDPNPVEAEHVLSLMRQNFPDKALGWVKDARWIGPVEIPQDRIDDDDMRSWAATRDKARVRHFAQRMRSGDEPHPAILVQEPGETRAKVIDGHHRALAARKLGRPVRAYVGFVDADGGPWDETHSYQFHQGDDPANKAFDPHEVRVPRGAPGGGRWVKVADWVHVGDHKVGEQVHHPEHGAGVVREVGKTTTRVDFGGGKRLAFARKPKAGATEHFTPKPAKAAKKAVAKAPFGATARKGNAATAATVFRFTGNSNANSELFPDLVERRAIMDAFAGYKGIGSARTNRQLRAGGFVGPRVDQMDRAFGRSPLRTDVLVYRGARGSFEFGPKDSWPPSLTGREWTESAYTSTSPDITRAEPFARDGVLMRIVVPQGTPAVGLRASHRIETPESEILLGRGQKFRVVADHGVDAKGRRLLDVEVVPPQTQRPSVKPVKAAKKAVPARATGRPPATPVPIRDLLNADDVTIEKSLRDVYEGRFGPYTTKVKVGIRRAGTQVSRRGVSYKVDPSIWVEGDILNADGQKIGNFSRAIGPSDTYYTDGVVRREVWAEHSVVELDDAKYQGKGFGGAFNGRAIEWYRASSVHGISQSDQNGYVWASQGFGFSGGAVPDYLATNMRQLVADLRVGKTRSDAVADKYRTLPKRFREAPDLAAQISEAEALLKRLETTKPGSVDYPSAYEISQLGRRKGQKGKTALWLGKLLFVSADSLILNPNEGEVISS